MDWYVKMTSQIVYYGGTLNWLRTGFNIMIPRIPRHIFTRPGNLPYCCCLGDRKTLQEAWNIVSDDVRALLVDAESKLTKLNSINLGPKRSFTVAECALWAALCGVRFAAQVAAVVSLEEVTKSHGKISVLAKDVAAIRYGHSTATSITKYLRSPVFGNRPKLVHKKTKAAAAEAAEIAAEAEAAARMEKTKRLAA